MKYNLSKYIYLLFSTLLFISCVTDDLGKIDNSVKDNLYRCFIRVPSSNVVTRAASNTDIDFSQLTILVYDQNKEYLTNAGIHIENTPPKYDDKLEAYELIISLPITNELSTLVFIANIEDFGSIEKGSALADLYANKRLSYTGKWGGGKSTLVPMWGEIEGLKLTGEYTNEQMRVSLLRAMAKVEVRTELTPQAFSIGSAHIYLSLAEGLIVPKKEFFDANNGKVTAPSLAANSPFNVGQGTPTKDPNQAKKSPLSYSKSQGELETIFIPEQEKSKDGNLDAFIVIGGYYRGETTETFYKVSFSENSQNKAFNILRNYRYILNVKKVNGLGYPTPENAMMAPTSNIEVEVVEWDENINNGYVFGDKYFGIQKETIWFNSPDAGQKRVIKFETNLSDEALETELDYKLNKGEESPFDLKLNVTEKQFEITTHENTSNDISSDKLIIDLYGEHIEIVIGQSPGDFAYYLDCDMTTVHGLYIPNVPLNNNNYVEIQVNSDEDLSGSYFRVVSSEVDGISFFGEGNFDMIKNSAGLYYQKIRMYGKGTPRSNVTKYLSITMNNQEVRTCNFEVRMMYSKKRILAQGLDFKRSNDHPEYWDDGYVMNAGYSKKFRESPYNFGSELYSTVKIEKIDYKFIGVEPMKYNDSDNNALEEALNDADIFVSARVIGDREKYPVMDKFRPIIKRRAEIISDFLKNNGVVIIMDQSAVFLKDLFRALSDIEVNAYNTGGNIGYSFKLVDIHGDQFLNGPFGNMNGKSWGMDEVSSTSSTPQTQSPMHTIIGIPEEDITIYANGLSDDELSSPNSSRPKKGALVLKHHKYNLFIVLNDAFILGKDIDRSNGNATYPFTVETNPATYKPIPNYKYGADPKSATTVHYAAIFGNILNWAFDAAEFRGKNSVSY